MMTLMQNRYMYCASSSCNELRRFSFLYHVLNLFATILFHIFLFSVIINYLLMEEQLSPICGLFFVYFICLAVYLCICAFISNMFITYAEHECFQEWSIKSKNNTKMFWGSPFSCVCHHGYVIRTHFRVDRLEIYTKKKMFSNVIEPHIHGDRHTKMEKSYSYSRNISVLFLFTMLRMYLNISIVLTMDWNAFIYSMGLLMNLK